MSIVRPATILSSLSLSLPFCFSFLFFFLFLNLFTKFTLRVSGTEEALGHGRTHLNSPATLSRRGTRRPDRAASTRRAKIAGGGGEEAHSG